MLDHFPLSRFVFHPDKLDDLTRKEITVIHYFLCDYNAKEIADVMHIHIGGVYKHRERILDKCPVHSFEVALAWLVAEGIFTVQKDGKD